MPFPRKFKNLLELGLSDVEAPDYVWLTYAVCACTPDACGWGGWIVELAAKIDPEKRHLTASGDKPLEALGPEQVCPACGKPLFRTGASVRLVPSADQTPGPRSELARHGAPGV